MKKLHNRDACLWLSAVDKMTAMESAGRSATAAQTGAAAPALRPAPTKEVTASESVAKAVEQHTLAVAAAPPPGAAAAVGDTVKYCATMAFKLGEAKVSAFFSHDQTQVNQLSALFGGLGVCDPKWIKAVEAYAASKIAAAQAPIPYIKYQQLSDFIIDGRLEDTATIAIVGDWGTGQPGARTLLAQIASKKPDVVFHLGDVYYSGTEDEVKNYFYAIWQQTLGLPLVPWGGAPADPRAKPVTFHLSGNHDMYSGGGPYYSVIRMLGQPASYFCLRNARWQFIAIDTGLHDANPLDTSAKTFLEDTEVAWLKDKIANAGGRKTVLLSHHQLFTRFDAIGNAQSTNDVLLGQLQDVLKNLTAWFWGHEHNLVIYKPFLNVLARCVGHGAFPVSPDDPQSQPFPNVPIEDVSLALDSTKDNYQHGYATVALTGDTARATYYEYDANTHMERELFTESLGVQAPQQPAVV